MATQKSLPLFNTTHLLPATGYYNHLMREIDDALWLDPDADVGPLEATLDDVKRNYVDKGEVWYPEF